MIRKITGYADILAATIVMKAFEQASSHVKVNIEYAAKTYTDMVEKGIAAFFVLEKDGDIVGGLGAIKCPDLHSGKLMAVETFWFVHPHHRGQGLRLLAEFEVWGKAEGCQTLAMIHMADSYPDRLEALYRRRGYNLAEKHYLKEI